MLVQQWKPLLLCVGLVLIFNVTDYMALSYLPSYLSATLHFNETHGLFLVLLVMVLMMPMTLVRRPSVGHDRPQAGDAVRLRRVCSCCRFRRCC